MSGFLRPVSPQCSSKIYVLYNASRTKVIITQQSDQCSLCWVYTTAFYLGNETLVKAEALRAGPRASFENSLHTYCSMLLAEPPAPATPWNTVTLHYGQRHVAPCPPGWNSHPPLLGVPISTPYMFSLWVLLFLHFSELTPPAFTEIAGAEVLSPRAPYEKVGPWCGFLLLTEKGQVWLPDNLKLHLPGKLYSTISAWQHAKPSDEEESFSHVLSNSRIRLGGHICRRQRPVSSIV